MCHIPEQRLGGDSNGMLYPKTLAMNKPCSTLSWHHPHCPCYNGWWHGKCMALLPHASWLSGPKCDGVVVWDLNRVLQEEGNGGDKIRIIKEGMQGMKCKNKEWRLVCMQCTRCGSEWIWGEEKREKKRKRGKWQVRSHKQTVPLKRRMKCKTDICKQSNLYIWGMSKIILFYTQRRRANSMGTGIESDNMGMKTHKIY